MLRCLLSIERRSVLSAARLNSTPFCEFWEKIRLCCIFIFMCGRPIFCQFGVSAASLLPRSVGSVMRYFGLGFKRGSVIWWGWWTVSELWTLFALYERLRVCVFWGLVGVVMMPSFLHLFPESDWICVEGGNERGNKGEGGTRALRGLAVGWQYLDSLGVALGVAAEHIYVSMCARICPGGCVRNRPSQQTSPQMSRWFDWTMRRLTRATR